MSKAHDVKTLADELSRVEMSAPGGARTGETAFASTPFTRLASFNHGGLFLGRFRGRTPWERHRRGDELVHVLEGEVDLTLMMDRGPVQATLRPGGVFVVPRAVWHRQDARPEVTVLTATPTPTDVSFADDPRIDKKRRRGGGKPASSGARPGRSTGPSRG